MLYTHMYIHNIYIYIYIYTYTCTGEDGKQHGTGVFKTAKGDLRCGEWKDFRGHTVVHVVHLLLIISSNLVSLVTQLIHLVHVHCSEQAAASGRTCRRWNSSTQFIS